MGGCGAFDAFAETARPVPPAPLLFSVLMMKRILENCCFEYDTPIGRVRIESDGRHIVSLDFVGDFTPLPAEGTAVAETPLISEAHMQLLGYLKGHRKDFTLPLLLRGTPFQKKVYGALLSIPYGETKSYGEIAGEIGSPKAARAVGGACHVNPVAILVPCHRVVGRGGALTGYGGGIGKKEALLALEKGNTRLFPFGEKELSHLSRSDERMAALIARMPKPRYELMKDLFSALVNSIIGQQISSKAHRSIWTRFLEGLDDITPQKLFEADENALRSFGISGRKAQYLKEAARFALSGGLSGAAELTDDQFRERLVSLRGVGQWTADMLLLFSLGRGDVFSYDDSGLRNGLCKLYGLSEISKDQFKEYGKKFSPYGSVASFYIWAANGEG